MIETRQLRVTNGGEGGAEGGIRESYFLKKKIEKGKGKEVT